jgi:hypothetical protein
MSSPTLTLFYFLKNSVPYNKIDPHKKKIVFFFVVFTTKELVLLSFVEVHFIKRLILRQNL